MIDAEMLRVVHMGPIIRMQVHEKRTRTPVAWSFFAPPIMIDTTYIDWRALDDPSQSDAPIMKKAVALGLYSAPEQHDEPYGFSFTWRRTEQGDAEAARSLKTPDEA